MNIDLKIKKEVNVDLKEKRILFFGVSFFSYELEMKKELEHQGAVVDYYNERSVTSSIGRAMIKIHPYIFYLKTRRYYDRILMKYKNQNIDYVFFWSTDMIFPSIIKKIKELLPNSKIINYQSDSIIGKKYIVKTLKYFDRTITYDRIDYLCLKEKLNCVQFRPLFFLEDYQQNKVNGNKLEYKISFIGTIHSDRFAIIKSVEKIAMKENYKIFIYKYLQSRFIYYFYRFTNGSFKGSSLNDFDFDKISPKRISKIYGDSFAILDMQFPKNNGLTMRTIETLASKKKLITTNKDIKNYDFYNPDNILIIDRKNPVIDKNFFVNDFIEIEEKIMDKYRLSSWIKDIFLYDNLEYKSNTFLKEE